VTPRVVALVPPTFTAFGSSGGQRPSAVRTAEAGCPPPESPLAVVHDAEALRRELAHADVLVLAPRFGEMIRDVWPEARRVRWIHSLGAGVEKLPVLVCGIELLQAGADVGEAQDGFIELAGAVEVGENPADTLGRELREEWSVAADRLSVEALVRTPSEAVLLVGQAWLPHGAAVRPDDEHDTFAWWPPDVAQWPAHADEPLRAIAILLSETPA